MHTLNEKLIIDISRYQLIATTNFLHKSEKTYITNYIVYFFLHNNSDLFEDFKKLVIAIKFYLKDYELNLKELNCI